MGGCRCRSAGVGWLFTRLGRARYVSACGYPGTTRSRWSLWVRMVGWLCRWVRWWCGLCRWRVCVVWVVGWVGRCWVLIGFRLLLLVVVWGVCLLVVWVGGGLCWVGGSRVCVVCWVVWVWVWIALWILSRWLGRLLVVRGFRRWWFGSVCLRWVGRGWRVVCGECSWGVGVGSGVVVV